MKLFKKLLYVIIFMLIFIPFGVSANSKANIYLFYGDGCPHCAALEGYLENEYSDNSKVNIYKYEVWNNKENQKLWQKVEEITGKEAKGVPYFVIGEDVYQGYSASSAWEKRVDKAIKKALKTDYNDNVGITLGVVSGKIEKKDSKESKSTKNVNPSDNSSSKKSDTNTKLDVPLVGSVDLRDMSLPVIAILIGLVDGFNPCAMWILIFLITMLFDYPSRKKMWILGCTFLFTSALIYFLFMISFLKVATFINSITILKIIVALFALVFGTVNIYRY